MKTDRLQIVFAHYNQPIPTEFAELLPPPKVVEALTPRQWKKWRSRQLAHLLLAKLLEQNQLDPNWVMHIQRTPSGRPYFAGLPIDFNISHSGDWVAVILAPQSKLAVGIDIEHPQKIRPYSALLAHYASADTLEQIHHSPQLPQLSSLEQRFYLDWCLREAVLKAQGIGIVKLAKVEHCLNSQTIHTPYCPQGWLYFYHQLPFYLAYFFEQPQSVLLSPPTLAEWRAEQFHLIASLDPIIYQVNPHLCQNIL